MSTLDNRPNTALLVIDVQNGVVGVAYDRDTVVVNLATFVEKARAANVEVVWVQHNDENLPRDTEKWQYVPEQLLGDSDPVVHKSYGDSFQDTNLGSVLAERRVGRLVVAGAQTDHLGLESPMGKPQSCSVDGVVPALSLLKFGRRALPAPFQAETCTCPMFVRELREARKPEAGGSGRV